MPNILIACGHDNYGNGGCVNPKYGKEQDFTRSFSKILVTPLRQKGYNVTVYNVYDTSKSMYTDLKNGTLDKSRLKKYDFIIELHFNAGVNKLKSDGKITGTEILLSKNNQNVTMCNNILKDLNSIGLKSRGIKYRSDLQNMNICKGLNIPYMLWEICFIDDDDDMQFYIKNAQLIANTFSKSFNL